MDQRVNRPPLGVNRFDHPRPRSGVSQIRRDRQGCLPQVVYGLHGGRQRFQSPADQGDPYAAARQGQRDAAPNPGAAAGNDRHSPLLDTQKVTASAPSVKPAPLPKSSSRSPRLICPA